MGGRTGDAPGSDFQHVLRYSPGSNTWTQMGVTLPDNTMNNMACGVLSLGGTPEIYCVGGSAAGQTTATARVFYYNPVTDAVTTLAAGDNWPGDAAGTILPGGFAETGNKMYILGGINYVGGASDFQGGLVVDTTNSFSFNPAANTTGAIAPIPRATGETRGLTFNGNMLVMGGGRVAPNPSNEVDAYNPGTNSWTVNSPVPAFVNARRNFPTDTDGTSRIWLAGGYEPSAPAADMEIFSQCIGPSPTPTATGTPSPTPTCQPGGTPGPWTIVANYPTTVESAAVASDGTYAYSSGGYPGSVATYRYDPVANSWSALANAPVAFADAGIAYDASTNKVYV